MPSVYVALQDRSHWGPLSDVTIRAVDADTGDFVDTQVTDITGFAVFDTADFPTNYYFKPEITGTRAHLLVFPPFGYDLYGIDANKDYVDGRNGWAVSVAGAVGSATEIQTSPDGTVMVHVDRINVNNMGDAYRSDDDGLTWSTLPVAAANLSCCSLAFSPTGVLWSLWINEPSADDHSFIYKSSDYGDTWTFVQQINDTGLGFTFGTRIRVDRETGYVAITRLDVLGSGGKYFKGGVGGTAFPTGDASGVLFSGDNNPGLATGLLEFTNGMVITASQRGTGGSERLRLHRMAEDGSAFTDVYTRDTLAASSWSQLLYATPGNLFASYTWAGGTGVEGLLRSTDSGATWTEIDVPSGFNVLSMVYDDQLDVLYIFDGGASSTTFYSLEDPLNAPASGADWVAVTGPVAGFSVNAPWQVTWVPKG
jgi:hypothetical protein